MVRVGLMLYTLRAECARDLEGTLRSVAELGYEGVEFWQLHGHDPVQVRAWLDQVGLAVVGAHASLERLERELSPLADELRVLGTDRVALSFIEPASDGVLESPGSPGPPPMPVCGSASTTTLRARAPRR